MSDADLEVDYTDKRIKHLEMIQGVISRMSSNSATVKRYAIVVAAAAISLARTADAPIVLFSTAILIVIFGLLDARYLLVERCYRDLYNIVREEPHLQRPDFRLDITKQMKGAHSMARVLRSWSVTGLYLALVGFMLVLMIIIWMKL